MTTRRELLIGLGLGALAISRAARGQQQRRGYRIGFLGAAGASEWKSRVDALRAGLREAGYIEGKNIAIEFRWAEGQYDRLPGLATELVRLKVDVLVTHGTPGTRAAKQATTTIPIVAAIVGDPVGSGLVTSLRRPGGNLTGSTFFNEELAAKRLEFLKDVVPGLRRVAVLLNPDNPLPSTVKAMEATAKPLKIALQGVAVRAPGEFEGAFAAMARQGIEAIAVTEESLFNANLERIAGLALKHRLPSIGSALFGDAGGLIGYGIDNVDSYRRAARLIDKILKGAKPADLPIERPTKFELVVNLKTAKAIGLTISQNLLFRADRVIE